MAGAGRQARVVVESEGKLKLNADGQEVKHLPLKVRGELEYTERVLSQAKQWSKCGWRGPTGRPEAKIKLHETELSSELRAERRLIAVESNAKDAVLFSPRGPLTREELELLERRAVVWPWNRSAGARGENWWRVVAGGDGG